MAGKYENYNGVVEEFNRKYGADFSFERYEIKLKQTAHMRTFFTGERKIPAEDFAYRTVAKEIFREAVESVIAKKVKSVDHTDFLNDFDKLMDSYREYCNGTGEKKPSKNGGWGNNAEKIDELAGKINDIPTDKSDFIKDCYVKRSIRLRDMRADLEGMEKEGKKATAEELSRAIVYKRALEKAIKERSFVWRAVHWFQGPAEKRNLEMVNEFIGKYADSPDMTQAEAFADENAIETVKSKLEAAKQEIKDKELLKPRKLNDGKLAEERMSNPKVHDHLAKLMCNIMSESTTSDFAKKGIANAVLNDGKKSIRSMWGAFEKAQTPEEKETAIIKYTQEIFNASFRFVNGLTFKDNETGIHDKIVACQRITNLMLMQYSPATSDSTYDKFFKDYVVNDKKFIGGFLQEKMNIEKIEDKDLSDIIDAINLDIQEKKIKVKDIGKDLNSNNVEKSDKHTDAPKLRGPVKEK